MTQHPNRIPALQAIVLPAMSQYQALPEVLTSLQPHFLLVSGKGKALAPDFWKHPIRTLPSVLHWWKELEGKLLGRQGLPALFFQTRSPQTRAKYRGGTWLLGSLAQEQREQKEYNLCHSKPLPAFCEAILGLSFPSWSLSRIGEGALAWSLGESVLGRNWKEAGLGRGRGTHCL